MTSLAARVRRLSLAALAGCAAGACGLTANQRQAAAAFSEAAVTVGSFAATTFPRLRQAAIAMNTTDVILDGHASPSDLDEGFGLDHVTSRVVAARALEDYGALLGVLIEDRQEDELTKAASSFVASAELVPGRKLSDAQYEALGALVEGIGGLLVKTRKARAIRRIVPAYTADVDHLCELLLRDFDPQGLHLAQRFEITLQRLDSDADLVLAPRGGLPVERLTPVDALRQVTEGRALLDVVGGRGRETVRALRKANTALEAALRDEVFSSEDVRTAASEVEGLTAAIQALGSGRP